MNELVKDRSLVNASDVNLSTWLTAPVNRLAFRCVPDILPVAEIANDPSRLVSLERAPVDKEQLTFSDRDGEAWTIDRFLEHSYADGFLILRDGRVAFEWYTRDQTAEDKHIIFSVTKSIVGSLVGILVEQGLLNPEALIVDYIPELSGGAYDQATVRHLLDMTVDLEFEESYLDPNSPFARYREATGWHNAKSDTAKIGMHEFLTKIVDGGTSHGNRFHYLSPNSDLLGWICERAAGQPLSTMISQLLWQPLGAESDAYITIDAFGAPRAAGGFGCTLRDIARFGECMRNYGRVANKQVIPENWVNDILSNGDLNAWNNSEIAGWNPGGAYRSQWWITNDDHGAYFAAGIYGHWLYISPAQGVVIAKQGSRPVGPASQETFIFEKDAFEKLAKRVVEAGSTNLK